MDQYSQTQVGDTSSDHGMSLNRELWQVLVEKAWLIACIMAAAAAIGVWVGVRSPVVYQSKAVIELDFGEKKVLAIDDFEKRDKGGGVDFLNTIANNVRSSAIIKRVVVGQSLTNHPYFTGGSNAPSEQMVVSSVSGAVDARLRRMTRLIDVTVELGDRMLAQTVAQSVVDEYIKERNEVRAGVGTNTSQFLMAEETRIKEKLLLAERAAEQYLRTNSSSLIQSQNIVTEEFKALNERRAVATDERRDVERDFEMTRRVGVKVAELLTLSTVSRVPEVVALKEKLQAQEAVLVNHQLRYKEKHPEMIKARAELESIRQQFEAEVLKAPLRLGLQLQAAIEKEKGLEAAFKEQEKKLSDLNARRSGYEHLQADVTLHRSLHDAVIKRLRELDIVSGDKSKSEVRVIEPANLPLTPIRPNKKMLLLYALAAGAALSVGVIWLLVQLDTTIKSVDHAERILGLPVLGAVPKNKLIRDGKGRLFISDDPQSLCAEAFRSMRASLGLLGREEDRKVVFFTSAVPSEGKSFCCVNYAVAYAQQGKRTLIIDFDLRKPTLAESFGIKEDHFGVSDVLLNKAQLEQAVQTTRFDNLFLLTAGTTVPNPAELLSGQWTSKLIKEASAKFDHVVLDNAPINAVSDALMIVKEAQTVCLVANARKTSYRAVLRALEMLRRAGAKPSGVVLNFLPQSAGSGYYYYYSGNKYYGQKGVYGATSSKG